MRRSGLKSSRRRISRARRAAAERVADEVLMNIPVVDAGGEQPELSDELAAMRRITAILEGIPAQAWATGLSTHPTAGRGPARRSTGQGIAPRVAATLVAALLAMAFIVGSITHPLGGSHTPLEPRPAGTTHVVLRPLPAGGGAHSQAIAYMTGGDHMLVKLKGLPRSVAGTYYELWLMTSNTHLVSVASFQIGTSGSGTLRLLLPDDPAHYRFLDISLQHVGRGSGISQLSVLRGAVPA